MDKQRLSKRAEDLRELAKAQNMDGLDRLKDLPKDDPIAEIGFLASGLGMNFGLAFDTEVPLKEVA